MLHELSISALGVIESARIAPGPGLTVVTGETGAGKTMILTGIGLILGGKPSTESVRTGHDEAVAEAVIDLPDGPARERAAEAGVAVDADGTVTIVRTVGATTRSRSIMGGRAVPQALLGEIAGEVVTVHGQADQVRLRTPARQRTTLDAYAGSAHAALLDRYRQAWQEWTAAATALKELAQAGDAERARVAQLREDLAALQAADIQPGERAAAQADAEVLGNAEALRSAAAGAHGVIAGDNEAAVGAALEGARRLLEEGGRHDPALAALAVRLADHVYGVADIAHELASYLDRLEADPMRLDALNARLAQIGVLERRFSRSAEELVALRASLEDELGPGDGFEDQLAEAARRELDARAAVADLALEVTASRSEAAGRLSARVMEELRHLAMADATVTIRVTPREPASTGADEVTWLLSAHPGAPERAIADAASGGELSRIMLAVEVALADGFKDGRTFVFDEVDAGVGGRAAQSVGQRLALLGRSHQVIVVTHLAQVAAYADTHVVVEKASDGQVTVSHVRAVSGEERVREVARLLSGEEDSSTARAHAEELLSAARAAF